MKVEIPEGFKVIPSFPIFAINKTGKVFSTISGKYRKTNTDSRGYLRITLEKEGKGFGGISVVVLICETFNGLCEYRIRKVRYKDSNPDNIHADNLMWSDQNATKEREALYFSRQVKYMDNRF